MQQKVKYALAVLLMAMTSYGQTSIKVMTYNLLHYPEVIENIDRKDDLRYVLSDYNPDILMVCELETAAGADEIINYCLQTPDNRYAAASFTPNHSGSYPLQQMLYYNTQKFELIDETYLRTYVRDINHYTLKLLTQTPDTIDVYVAHLKASAGTTNENERLDMINVMTNDLQNIPDSHYVIFGGDFNLYNSDEPAYQEIIDNSNAIVLKDPINLLGNWHVNYAIRNYVTQSTHTDYSQDYVSGGLDDRFDFLMLSDNMFNNANLHYVSNTYKSYGNNGNCFNKAINSNDCAGTTYDTTLRNHLYTMSDHLPVVLTLESSQTLAIKEGITMQDCHIIGSNLVREQMRIFTDSLSKVSLVIYNSLGQNILERNNYENSQTINISFLRNGVYWVKISSHNSVKILKFVKTN